jgi:hypothetical protein
MFAELVGEVFIPEEDLWVGRVGLEPTTGGL